MEDYDMIIENPYELFLLLLSNVRQDTERATQMFQDFNKIAQNADVKEALDARVFASQRMVEKLDECFMLIGIIRTHWKGLSGGSVMWNEVRQYLAALKERSR